MRLNTRVSGHTLIAEGWAHDDNGEPAHGRSGEGRAKCSCGDLSDPLPSASARKMWHRDHKAAKAASLRDETETRTT